MSSFGARTAKHWLVIRVAKEFKKVIEQAGLDNLKTLAENGTSIMGTYLNACSPKEKARYRREFNGLLGMGVTIEMVLSELARQMPVIVPMMEGEEDYKSSEVQVLEQFLKET